jgi:integrase
MKPKGRHRERVLTAIKVKALSEPGRFADWNGLYLMVDPSGAKRWVLRVVVQGRRRDLGLGGAQLVSLSEARERALELRKVARAGGDPVADKTRPFVPTFEEAARTAHQEHVPAWKNGKHAAQWLNTLAEYAFPTIGNRRVNEIETPEVLKVLSPIWLSKPETARRVKQRMGTVFDWSKAAGYRSGDNPVLGVAKGLPRQPERTKHHATLPFEELPGFVRKLRASDAGESTKLAFEFLILTATRTSEVLEARWSEIDGRVWTIPAERMKAKREHKVPLSPRCLQILRGAKELSDGGPYVFPGNSQGKPLSNMVFLMTLRRMDLPITAHGFRSAFRDWAAERTNFPREVCEAALAHTLRDKTEAAYRRSDLFEKRRSLMNDWADFVSRPPTKHSRSTKPKTRRALNWS